jgi:hypothetical protein
MPPIEKTLVRLERAKTSTCRSCEKSAQLIKAHIIPSSFYQPLRVTGLPKEYSTAPGVYSKRRPNGIYDKGILCAACDNSLGRWDGYAAKVLCRPLGDFGDVEQIKTQERFVLHPVEYKALKLFFVSLLWRCHISTHTFFEQVNLGRWASTARDMLATDDPGPPEVFGMSLVRYDHRFAASIHGPEVIRVDGVNMYRLSLPNYAVLVTVDKRGPARDLGHFLLSPNGPFFVLVSDFEKSISFKEALEHFRRNSYRR